MAALLQDLRYAARGVGRSPGFAAVAVLTLGLGIGAATTVFSVVNGVLLQPLPYRAPDRIVNVWNDFGPTGQSLPAVSAADFLDYKAQARLFDDFAAGSGGNMVGATGILTGEGAPERADVSTATANFFPLLGVDPFLGRHFTAEEERLGGPDVVLLTHGLWQRRYGGDPDLVGRTIELDGTPHRVVGVLPPGFHLLLPAEAFWIQDAEIWKPLQVDYGNLPPRNWTWFTVFGRLKRGVTVDQAQAEMDAIAARLRAQYPEHAASGLRIRVVPLHEDVVKGVRPTLLLLLAAAAVVVLIACVNVANLLLARATARGEELSIRIALGASRGRLVRQLLTESLVLALLGGAVGLGLTLGILEWLAHTRPANLPRLSNVVVDWTVLGFTIGLCGATALLFGLAPAVHGAGAGLGRALAGAGRVAGRGGMARLRNALIVAELALSLVLLADAGLLLRSFLTLQEVRPGFETEGRLTFQLSLPAGGYPDADSRRLFFRELEDRLTALPGVRAAGAVSQLPLTGSGVQWPYAYDEQTRRQWESVTADRRVVTPGYFRAMGTRLLAGRFFTEADAADDPGVIVIDETLAREAWPGRSAVGQRLQLEPEGGPDPELFATVVGVVEHVRIHDLGEDVRAQIYDPYTQAIGRTLGFVVHADVDPASLAPAVHDVVSAMDPDLAVEEMVPLRHYVSDALAQSRLSLTLMQAVSGIALVLVAIGMYGVIAYSVGRRTREFGVRLALGASPRGLLSSVVLQGLRLVAASVALGLAGAVLTTRFLSGLLFQVDPLDPPTLIGVSAFLAAVAALACWVPARRAAHVNPLVALRAE